MSKSLNNFFLTYVQFFYNEILNNDFFKYFKIRIIFLKCKKNLLFTLILKISR